jgi:hypothetical protein
MPSVSPDVSRLRPTSDSLNVILKNTHFRDDILSNNAAIKLRVDHSLKVPVLVFKFPESFYDFVQILGADFKQDKNLNWLNKKPIIIKLILSDPVVTDLLSEFVFTIEEEGQILKDKLQALKLVDNEEIQTLENHIYNNVNQFLV